jgi:hypothetical protein
VPKKDKPKKDNDSGVTLDPANTALIAGNTATFVAREAEGVPTVTIAINGVQNWAGVPSNSSNGARISKIIETGHSELTVTFSEDGTEYASGTFTVE